MNITMLNTTLHTVLILVVLVFLAVLRQFPSAPRTQDDVTSPDSLGSPRRGAILPPPVSARDGGTQFCGPLTVMHNFIVVCSCLKVRKGIYGFLKFLRNNILPSFINTLWAQIMGSD
ncbi:hypothetical protein CPB85DRAFT_1322802 [Mucidula mucida]|nr:hypothetical protein CPB85DRAFT_1322802 [Mucidula mucida]